MKSKDKIALMIYQIVVVFQSWENQKTSLKEQKSFAAKWPTTGHSRFTRSSKKREVTEKNSLYHTLGYKVYKFYQSEISIERK